VLLLQLLLPLLLLPLSLLLVLLLSLLLLLLPPLLSLQLPLPLPMVHGDGEEGVVSEQTWGVDKIGDDSCITGNWEATVVSARAVRGDKRAKKK
jgi:hypothetical protein